VKTAKLLSTMQRMVSRGVRSFKCATTLELLTACEAGAEDVVIAFPAVGARCARLKEIAGEFPDVALSLVVDDASQLPPWRGTRFGVFLDINPGMDRTGFPQADIEGIVRLADAIRQNGLRFRGLHYYDGNRRHANLDERMSAAFAGYDELMRMINAMTHAGFPVEEVITSGTPALPCALAYGGFRNREFRHTVSAGTVVYNDVTSLSQLPGHWGYKAAVTVLASVISHPTRDIVTVDAGHKTVSADSGDPNSAVVGHPELTALHPSEEHLPFGVADGSAAPAIGEQLQLIPRHVCPTVNNFDHVVMIQNGNIVGLEKVTARGREAPLDASKLACPAGVSA
jgi:D-serine deaminase-like pyridoxal phosphate-dependent protein